MNFFIWMWMVSLRTSLDRGQTEPSNFIYTKLYFQSQDQIRVKLKNTNHKKYILHNRKKYKEIK